MKQITINYLSHHRTGFSELTFHFLSKIKTENKEIITINILATHECEWEEKCKSIGIDYNIYIINSNNNYNEKLNIAIKSSTKYSVKLDEDCFINNYVWDFIIENIDVLDYPNILSISPIMSNNIPSCDLFINDYIKDDIIKNRIFNNFLNRSMPDGLWGINYTPLNKHTIEASEWNYKNFYDGVKSHPTIVKGIHPLRICYDSQMLINEYIGNNLSLFNEKNNYEFIDIDAPYFTNSFFFIKTEEWKNIVANPLVDCFDEISLNNYKTINNKRIVFVKNGYGIHMMFNTVYGNKNPWGIGGEDGESDERNFYNKLKEQIII